MEARESPIKLKGQQPMRCAKKPPGHTPLGTTTSTPMFLMLDALQLSYNPTPSVNARSGLPTANVLSPTVSIYGKVYA